MVPLSANGDFSASGSTAVTGTCVEDRNVLHRVGADTLRVVHVVLSMDVGGLERVVLDLVREASHVGQKTAVICLERPGTLAAQVEQLGSTVYCVHKTPGLRLRIVRSLRSVLEDFRPDVVHTHQIGALLYAGAAARRLNVPVVVHTEHGKHFGTLRRRVLGRIAGRNAQRCFCVSGDIAATVTKVGVFPDAKIREIANGIDTSKFQAITEADVARIRHGLRVAPNAPLVGTVGRLNEVKRQDVLIRAFARLTSRLPDAALLLVGDGPLRSNLSSLARDLGVADRVHFAGYQARPELFLRAMDVFALTSESEGMPLSVLEAWAAGVPVVGSGVGGLPQLIQEGQTGRLFPFPDHEVLAAVLVDLLTDRPVARAMACAGRERVERLFSARRMAEDYHAHYVELMASRSTGRRCAERPDAQ